MKKEHKLVPFDIKEQPLVLKTIRPYTLASGGPTSYTTYRAKCDCGYEDSLDMQTISIGHTEPQPWSQEAHDKWVRENL